jgi:hypothetical protein
VQPAIRVHRVQAANCAHDFRDAARVENFLVQVMARAVVAQVQARDVVARSEQRLGERQHVQRIRAALPTVQQQTARRSGRGRPRFSWVEMSASSRTPSPQSTIT